ncbi:DMT family transporter [Halorhabdus rudnickae]|uniref:DMT family transporter n=1 Tax=Halorhabdus rudnickae TaxID=1775544 RepID=UPI001083F92B|nr:EamA family transporter [Halorhabdus rudnickae]
MRYRNALLFVSLAAIWGSAFVAIKAGLAAFPPVLFAAIRYDVAGVLVLGYAALVTDPLPRDRRDLAAIAVGATLLIAGYHALLFVGERSTTSAVAAVLVSLSPVLTTGVARVALPEERLSVVGLTGLSLGFLGVIVVARPAPANLLAKDILGPVLIVGAALSFAVGSVLTRRLDADLSIEAMEGWSMVGGAILLHGLSHAVGESAGAIDWTPRALVALGYLSLVASAIGFLLYFDLLDRLGPVEINLVSYVAPLFAALTGFLLLGEPLAPATGAGFLLIVLGFVAIKRDGIRAALDRHFRQRW